VVGKGGVEALGLGVLAVPEKKKFRDRMNENKK
jgi:hypothetical protein